MEITIYNWWFSIYIPQVVEFHTQMGWAIAAVVTAVLLRQLKRRFLG
jgi:hypothetical protein